MAEGNTHDAADRIEEFLEQRAKMPDLDPDVVHSANGYDLTVEDLQALVAGYRDVYSNWVVI